MSKILNVEIKAKVKNLSEARKYLLSQNADFRGTDHQIDTYFNTPKGRLKLREGNIECSLIGYHRENQAEAKRSDIGLQKLDPSTAQGIREALTMTIGQRVVVDKSREIYFIDNVKFHLDNVKGLGEFVEIEAIDSVGNIGEEKLREQCKNYQELLGIQTEQLLTHSYSELILDLNKP